LDEFADSLDIDTRIKLQENFSTITNDRTVIDAQNVISHALDYISNYDLIIVLEKSKVAGVGKHVELIKNCEVYKQILEKEEKLSAISELVNTGKEEESPVDRDNI
jgi:ABC-type multidrug transport system fused ATPase/permease subunit